MKHTYKPFPHNVTVKESPIHGLDSYKICEIFDLKLVKSRNCIYILMIEDYIYKRSLKTTYKITKPQ